MSNILTIVQRELGAFFLSPIAYVVNAVFLFACGLAFGLGVFQNGAESSLRALFDPWVILFLVLVVPVLTMRLISDELRSGTIETLLTIPVTETQVVLGKFLGAWCFFVIMLATMLLYPVLLSRYGSVDFKLLACNYLGLLLLGGLFTAVGLFFSTCTRHQIIAVILSILILIVLSFASFELAQQVEAGWIRVVLQHLSIRSHFSDFVRGMLDLNHVVFFLTTTGLFLFFSVKKLEMRRWQ